MRVIEGLYTLLIGFALTATGLTMPALVRAQTETVLYDFPFPLVNGRSPYAPVIADSSGNFYGATALGSTGGCSQGCGLLFELSQVSGVWTETILHRFSGGRDGGDPSSALIFDAKGNLYGTTVLGGNKGSGGGTVYQLSPSGNGWKFTIIHTFSDAGTSWGSLIVDASGNLYGTTRLGGPCRAGTVFKLTPTSKGWQQTILYTFTGGADGAYPTSSLVFDKLGNLYGSAAQGGDLNVCYSSGCGVVFQLSPTKGGYWKENVLYTFSGGPDGSYPTGLVFGRDGGLYGSAAGGGNANDCIGRGTGGCGVVFELTANSFDVWTESVLLPFNGVTDGQNPVSGPVFGPDGNLYGSTPYGGSAGYGTLYELTPTQSGWQETVLHNFVSTDGIEPAAPPYFDPAGNIYGTTQGGGRWGWGTVFEFAK